MKIEKVTNFVSTATTGDLLLTFFLLIVATAVVSSIIYIAFNLPRMFKQIKDEIKIANNHLAHLDHNNYTDYSRYPDTREEIKR